MASVYFDLDGTLVEFDRPFAALFADACRELDLPGDPASPAPEDPASPAPDDPTSPAPYAPFHETYSDRFFEALSGFEDRPYRVAAAELVESHGLDLEPRAFAAALVDEEVASTRPRPGAPAVVEALAGDGHALGVLTNGVDAVQRRKLAAVGLLDRFDDVYVPFEEGRLKPDPAVFEAAKARLPGTEHVLVGDSLEHDVEPAREAGFTAVHVDGDDPLDGLLGRHLPELFPAD